MACNCKEVESFAKQNERKRQEWNARAMALLSEIATIVSPADRRLAQDLTKLIADLNALSIGEKQLENLLKTHSAENPPK